MIFRPHLADAVIRGEKTVTRRVSSHNPRSPHHSGRARGREGKRIAIQAGRGGKAIGSALCTEAAAETFDPNSISNREARREGLPPCA